LLAARVHNEETVYSAMVVNLSRAGALVTITDSRFKAGRHAGQDMGLLGLRVASQFADTFNLELPNGAVVVECELARVSEKMDAGSPVLVLGVRFLRSLTDDECERLEFDHGTPLFVEGAKAPVPDGSLRVVGPVTVAESTGDHVLRQEPEIEPGPVQLNEGDPTVYTIEQLMTVAVKHRSTDLHIKAGSPVRIRVDGELRLLGDRRLDSVDATRLVRDLLDDEQFMRFEECGDLDMACTIPGMGRFRVNVLLAQGEKGLAIRRIPEDVPSVPELGLSQACLVMAERPRGLVLVTGPTGSGKSTTLAAMIRHINETRACHIVTMEDPIEYIHREHLAHVTQREIGRDTAGFASALKRSLRQDPDVILVGEMRDLETVSLAVTAAETGHLVLATLHTTSAVLTVDRIVDVFPPLQQRQIRMQLADCLQGIVSQILIPKIRGGLVVAQEVLVANDGIRALIREGKSPQIGNMMQTGARDGMHTLEDSLNHLVATGEITFDAAVARANIPTYIKDPRRPGGGPVRRVLTRPSR
jgi:twitching motility protein PilT